MQKKIDFNSKRILKKNIGKLTQKAKQLNTKYM